MGIDRGECAECALLTFEPVCGFRKGEYITFRDMCHATCQDAVVVYDGYCMAPVCSALPYCYTSLTNLSSRFYCDHRANCHNRGSNLAQCVCTYPYVGAGTPGTCTEGTTSTPAPCTGGRVYGGCAGCDKTCDNPAPFCGDVCMLGCTCPPAYPYWDAKSGQCLTSSECSGGTPATTTTAPPLCPEAQVLSNCSNCAATCLGKPAPDCRCDGVRKCVCDNNAGFYWSDVLQQVGCFF